MPERDRDTPLSADGPNRGADTLSADERETLAALEADVGRGLDALDTPTDRRPPWWRRLAAGVLPPIVAVVVFIVIWQLLWASAIWPEFKLPAPAAVFGEIGGRIAGGDAGSIVWTSISRAVLGFALAVVVATPIGLVVATVPLVRSAIGPILTGLQSLPSVAWVPAAVLWFGLTDATIYFVVLLGAVPSIANGLVSGIDQVPPLLPRVGHAMGASRLQTAFLVMLPASLPGFLAGLKQGWAFSWRSLMAAEIIATSPTLGFGLGAYLQFGQVNSSMPAVMAAIIIILVVGIGIELLVFRPAERRVLRARGLAVGA